MINISSHARIASMKPRILGASLILLNCLTPQAHAEHFLSKLCNQILGRSNTDSEKIPSLEFSVSEKHDQWIIHIPADPLSPDLPYLYAFSDGFRRFKEDFKKIEVRLPHQHEDLDFLDKYIDYSAHYGDHGILSITLTNRLAAFKRDMPQWFDHLDQIIRERLTILKKEQAREYLKHRFDVYLQSGFTSSHEVASVIQTHAHEKIKLDGHPPAHWPKLNHLIVANPGGGYLHWTTLEIEPSFFESSDVPHFDLIELLKKKVTTPESKAGNYFKNPLGDGWFVQNSSPTTFVIFKDEADAKTFSEQLLQSEIKKKD